MNDAERNKLMSAREECLASIEYAKEDVSCAEEDLEEAKCRVVKLQAKLARIEGQFPEIIYWPRKKPAPREHGER